MSATPKDGGPAFPFGNEANVNGTTGMTLRDYFAGQALIGSNLNPRSAAEYAYKYADAMLAERQKESAR